MTNQVDNDHLVDKLRSKPKKELDDDTFQRCHRMQRYGVRTNVPKIR